MSNMTIAIDFDGTIVKHEYPRIGEPVPNAIECIHELQRNHRIILYTMRGRLELQEAVNYCIQNGIILYGVNENPSDNWSRSPKVYAHKYIDDAAIGCPLIYPPGERPYVDWQKVMDIFNNTNTF